jgi:DNA polymerase III subunit gamma/tau
MAWVSEQAFSEIFNADTGHVVHNTKMIETYIPLYRKYRPQAFADLIGQASISTAIQHAIELNKITHAYLFCGPRGTGKTSSARILAKSLNCETGPTITPCQICPSCISVTAGQALDVIEIDAASNNGVESIRDLTEKVHFAPLQGRYKIYIIDEVHMLSAAAFNALLKTLEEPPANVIFIFATTEAHKVIPTIISRCQRFDFSRISPQHIAERLATVAQQEDIAVNAEALSLIAKTVRGGMRDALGLLDQVSVLGRSENRTLTVDDIRLYTGSLAEDILFDLSQAIIEKRPDGVLLHLNLLQDKGLESMQLVKELAHYLRHLLIAKTAPQQPESVDVSAEMYQKLLLQSALLAIEELTQMLSRLSQLETQLRFSQSPLLWLEVGLLDLVHRQDIYTLKTLQERLSKLESGIQTPAAASPSSASLPKPISSQQPAIAPAPKKPPSSPTPTLAVEGVDHAWQRLIQSIGHIPTQSLLKDHFNLVEETATQLQISYSRATLYEAFKRGDKMQHLETAVNAFYGGPKTLHFIDASLLSHAPAPVAQVPVTPPEKPALVEQPTVTEQHPVRDPAVANPMPQQHENFNLAEVKQSAQTLLQARVLD